MNPRVLRTIRRWVRRHERLRRLAGRIVGQATQFRARGLSLHERWSRAISYESTFWEDWLATRAFGNEAEYQTRLDPDLPVTERLLSEALEALDRPEVAILDVGAGPLTTV